MGVKSSSTTLCRKTKDKGVVQKEFRKQAKILVDGGMDFIICEVCFQGFDLQIDFRYLVLYNL